MIAEKSLKEIEDIALKSGNFFAIGTAISRTQDIRKSIISNFKYHHCHMTDNDIKELNRLNNVPLDSLWQCGDCLRVKDNVLTTFKSFDPYKILFDINMIINRRLNNDY